MLGYVLNENPQGNWLQYTEIFSWVWLVKEKEPAQIVKRYEILENASLGKVVIHRQNGNIESWIMTPTGNGNDGLPLLFPYKKAEIEGLRVIISKRYQVIQPIIDPTKRSSVWDIL